MKKTHKTAVWAFAAFLLGSVLSFLIGAPNTHKLLAPVTTFGIWLRNLSLSGFTGNIAAWSILLGISAIPVFGLLWKPRHKADWLLLLASGELFTDFTFW